jgi:O-antigen/teichoic acid export membrane protein
MDSAFLKYAAFKDIGDDKDNFSTPFISIFVTSFLFSVLLILLKSPITNYFDLTANKSYLILLSALILFFDSNAVISFLKLRLERKAKLFTFIKMISILTNIFLNIFLIVVLKWGIEGIFISNLAASFLAFFLLLPTLIKNFKFNFHKVLFKRLMKFGLPYLPAGFGVMLVQVVDVPILQSLTDAKTVGIYKANYKLGIFMMLFVNMFQYAWQPFFLTNAKEKNAKEIFSKVLTFFTIAGSLMFVFLSLFISDIVQIDIAGFSIIGSKYWSGLYIVPVVLLAYLFNGLYVVFSAGIYIEGKSIYAPIVAGLGAITNVAANYILIPHLNIMGAALATLASYLVMAAGYYIVTQKYYHIQYEYSKLLKIAAAMIFVSVVFYVMLFSGYLNLLYKLILFAAFFSFVLIYTFDKSEINFLRTKILRK